MLDKKGAFGQNYIYCVMFIWSGASVLLNTTIKTFFSIKKESLNSIVDYAVLVLLIINIILFQKYTKRDIAIIVMGTLLIGYVTINSNNKTLMAAWIFVVAAKNAVFEKVVRSVYISQLLCFLLVIYMFFWGYIDEYTTYRGSILRHSLGFSHPNQLGVVVFLLVICRIYLRKDRLGYIDAMVTLLISIFLIRIPNSKTSFYALVIMGIIIFIHVTFLRLHKELSKLAGVYVFLTAFANVFSIAMSVINIKSIAILKLIDKVMSQRFSMCYKTYKYFGIKPFGQDVQLFINRMAYGKVYHFWLDNSYMAILLRYGYFVYLAFSVVYISTVVILKREKKYLLVEIMFLFAVYGVMENNFYSISQNVFLLLLAMPLFQELHSQVEPRMRRELKQVG